MTGRLWYCREVRGEALLKFNYFIRTMQVTDQQIIKALETLFDLDVEKYNFWVSELYDGIQQNYLMWNELTLRLIEDEVMSISINN